MIRRIKNIELKDYNSFGVQAIASELIEFGHKDDLIEVFDTIGERPWYILAGGNNILFTKEWDGVLIHSTMKKIEVIEQTSNDILVQVDSAVEWDDFVQWCVDRDFWGAENLSLIPGHIGSSPVQNIGAYGTEAKDIIESVELFNIKNRNFLRLHNSHCEFGYRDSIFKRMLKGAVVITSVVFRLSKIANPKLEYGDLKRTVDELGEVTISNIRKAVIKIRESKLPDCKVTGNAGSFFKNPIVESDLAEKLKAKYPLMPTYNTPEGIKIPAGWLIEQSGYKGTSIGAVGTDHRQALVIINLGGATGLDILQFAQKIQSEIDNTFDIKLEMEVNIL